jgi:hypothetical protein
VVGQEEKFPWRTGTGRAFRLPRTNRALAVGVWRGDQPHHNDEDGPSLSFRNLSGEEAQRVLDQNRP